MKQFLHNTILPLAIALTCSLVVESSQYEFIEEFGELQIYDTIQNSPTNYNQLAQKFSEDFNLNNKQIERFGYQSKTHLIIDLCINRSKPNKLKLFHLSEELSEGLQLNNRHYLSYNELKPFRKAIAEKAKISPFSDTQFFPATNLELKILNQKLLFYENIQAPFSILPPSDSSFSKKVETLITQLPSWLEALQNQQEGFPHNEAASYRFKNLYQEARNQPRFLPFFTPSGDFSSFESALIKSAERSIFPQALVGWATTIDFYSQKDFNNARQELIKLNSPHKTNRHSIEGTQKRLLILLQASMILFFSTTLCVTIYSFFLKRKFFNLTFVLLLFFWAAHVALLITSNLTSFSPPQLTLLSSTGLLFLAPCYRSRNTDELFICTLLGVPTLISWFIQIKETPLNLISEVFPKSLLLLHNASLSLSFLAILTGVFSSLTLIAFYLRNRKTTEPFLLKRIASERVKNHIHVLNLSALLSLSALLLASPNTSSLTDACNPLFLIFGAIICLNGFVLQQRWVNRLSLNLLIRYSLLLFFVSLGALFQLTTPLENYYPKEVLILSFSRISLTFIVCGLLAVLGSYLPHLSKTVRKGLLAYTSSHAKKT